jgi:DNA-binding MltR family transcriptional regulator
MSRHQDPSDSLKGFSVDALSSVIFDSPDWPTCLMAITFLENILENALNIKFDGKLTKTEREQMFSGYGPLSTFSSKISIGYAVSLFTKEAKSDLNKMKSIRNEAAHRINEFSFSLAEVSQICSTLQLVDAPTKEQFERTPLGKEKWRKLRFESPRAKFTLAFFNVITQILINNKIYITLTLPNKQRQDAAIQAILAKSGIDYPSLRIKTPP